MRIPDDAIIPASKLIDYLLVPRPWDDKPKFLQQAGFISDNPQALEAAIRRLANDKEAIEDGENDYGTFFRVVGPITGPNGMSLRVALIWLQWKADKTIHFVTLKPARMKE